jgi:NADP-dependent 3-hydroxy acid dehydrogenase YdfG
MITRVLAKNGAHRVYIVSRRKDVLQQAAQSINPEIFILLPSDVTSHQSLLSLASKVEL